MLSSKDLKFIKHIRETILKLKYKRKIESQVFDDDNLIDSKEHIISIHKLDEEHYIVKTIYKLSVNDIKSL